MIATTAAATDATTAVTLRAEECTLLHGTAYAARAGSAHVTAPDRVAVVAALSGVGAADLPTLVFV